MQAKSILSTLALGCTLSLPLFSATSFVATETVQAKDPGKTCRNLARQIVRQQDRGRAVRTKLIARYRYYCAGGSSSQGFYPQSNYSSQQSYSYQSSDGNSYQRSYNYQSPDGYSSQQSYSYQSSDYGPPSGYSQGYAGGPATTIVTPRSHVQIQRGGVTIQTPNSGIRVDY